MSSTDKRHTIHS